MARLTAYQIEAMRLYEMEQENFGPDSEYDRLFSQAASDAAEIDALRAERDKFRAALENVVQYARPAFHRTPYRSALDVARAMLSGEAHD